MGNLNDKTFVGYIIIAIAVAILISFGVHLVLYWRRNARQNASARTANDALVRALIQCASDEIKRVADDAIRQVSAHHEALEQKLTALEHSSATMPGEAGALAGSTMPDTKELSSTDTPPISAPHSNHPADTELMMRLAEQGEDNARIAQRLGISRGEVDLALNLRRNTITVSSKHRPSASHPAQSDFPIEGIEANLQRYFSNEPALDKPILANRHRDALVHAAQTSGDEKNS